MLCHYLKIFLIILMTPTSFIEGALQPSQSMDEPMTCEEFGRSARFNPYSVQNEVWFIFYSWGTVTKRQYKFFCPTSREKRTIQGKLENTTVPVNWTAPMVIMQEIHTKLSSLLVQKGERGEFWKYDFHLAKMKKSLEPEEIRMKQTLDNTFIGMMNCKTELVFAMCRIIKIPKKKWLKDAAAAIGYRGRGGISYLYQGHHWMPIDEDEEEEFWRHPEDHRRRAEALEKYLPKDHTQKPDDSPKPSLFPESITLEP